MLTSIVSVHWRHGCPTCSVAPSGQVPKPLCGAPKARDLTAKARTELPSIRRGTDTYCPGIPDAEHYGHRHRQREPPDGRGDVPHFVEHCEAVAAEIDVKRRWLGEQGRRVSFCSGVLPERHVTREVACEPSVVGSLWAASCIAAAVQRIAIEAERHRFTLRQTRRTVLITFSIMLVQASERRSSFGNPSRVTVRISSMPSRIEPATPDQSRSRRWARLRISFSALSASSSSQACRNTRRTEACSDLGNRSVMLRALWT